MNPNKKCEICGADLKISKNGNEYCSNICWKKQEYDELRECKRLEAIKVECTDDNLN